MTEGDHPLPIGDLWRGRFEGDLGRLVADMQSSAEKQLGIGDDHLARLSFTRKPKGIGTGDLNDGQLSTLHALIGCYLDRLPDSLADQQKAMVESEFEKITFAWAGGDERYQLRTRPTSTCTKPERGYAPTPPARSASAARRSSSTSRPGSAMSMAMPRMW